MTAPTKTTQQVADIFKIPMPTLYSLLNSDVLPGKTYSPNQLKRARSHYLFTLQDVITLAVARDLIDMGIQRRAAGQIASQAALMKFGERSDYCFEHEVEGTGISLQIDIDRYVDQYGPAFVDVVDTNL